MNIYLCTLYYVPMWQMQGSCKCNLNIILTWQAATRSCFYAGFAAQRNFAEVNSLISLIPLYILYWSCHNTSAYHESIAGNLSLFSSWSLLWQVIAKGEAQGMVSKSIGIVLGIALANCVQSSTPLALASFGVVTWIHMYCNLRSYQSIHIRTLNPYRASIISLSPLTVTMHYVVTLLA